MCDNDVIIVDYSKMTMEEREAYAIARVKEKELAEKKLKKLTAKDARKLKNLRSKAFYGTRHGTGVVQAQLSCSSVHFAN